MSRGLSLGKLARLKGRSFVVFSGEVVLWWCSLQRLHFLAGAALILTPGFGWLADTGAPTSRKARSQRTEAGLPAPGAKLAAIFGDPVLGTNRRVWFCMTGL